MHNFITPFKVGLVIILGIIFTAAMIIKFSAKWGQSSSTYELYAYFDDVTGLAPRSQVRIAGIQVGEVTKIKLVVNKAQVFFIIKDSVELFEGELTPDGHYKNGVSISKKLSGIIGNNHLELTTGVQGRKLQNGDEVKNVLQSTGPETLLNSASNIMTDVSSITSTVSKALTSPDGESKIQAMLSDMQETTNSIRMITTDNKKEIEKIIKNIESITNNADNLTKNANQDMQILVDKITELTDEVKNLVTSTNNNIDKTALAINQSVQELNQSLTQIREIAESINRGEGTAGKLLKDDTLANEAEELLKETKKLVQVGTNTVDSAKSLIAPLSDLQTYISLRNDYLVRYNAFKNIFGIQFRTSPNKAYLFDVISDPRGNTTTTYRYVSASGTAPTFEEVKETTSSIKFSIQLQLRWNFLAGRFGLIENSGGAGANLYLFKDRLEIMTDVFDLNKNKYPRIRFASQFYLDLFLPWTLANYLYISAGADDPLNKNSFDYFFGIGFKFHDKDLKSIMTVMPKIN